MKKTGLLLCILTLCCIASCFINPDRYKCSWTSPENVQFRAVQKLKHQIDTAKMITYLDKVYNFTFLKGIPQINIPKTITIIDGWAWTLLMDGPITPNIR